MKITNLIENTEGAAGCTALHGLSFYIETANHKILFDAGQNDETLKNARTLGIDLRQVDIAVLSHGHYDHSGGLLAFAELTPNAKIFMQKTAAGEQFAFDGVEKGYRYIGIDKKLCDLPQVQFVEGDFKIDDELSLFTVDAQRRKFPLPSTNKRIMKKIERGGQISHIQDDFSHEQSLFVRDGCARVLLSGCAHSGILNILEEFVRKFGRENLPQKLISGFHLMKMTEYSEADEAEIIEIAKKLLEYPCKFYTCHCTGEKAYALMKSVMGERLEYVRTGKKV